MNTRVVSILVSAILLVGLIVLLINVTGCDLSQADSSRFPKATLSSAHPLGFHKGMKENSIKMVLGSIVTGKDFINKEPRCLLTITKSGHTLQSKFAYLERLELQYDRQVGLVSAQFRFDDRATEPVINRLKEVYEDHKIIYSTAPKGLEGIIFIVVGEKGDDFEKIILLQDSGGLKEVWYVFIGKARCNNTPINPGRLDLLGF